MDYLIGLCSILIGYLIGSISFSRVVAGLVSPETDLRAAEAPVDGTDKVFHMSAVSATSVRLKLGPRYGCLASLLDMVKVAVPVAVLHYAFPLLPASFLAAAGAIIGHNWPLYYRFRGGYGHSAIYGALLVIDWTSVPVSLLGTAVFYFFSRQVHFAALGGVMLLIPWLGYRSDSPYAILYAGVCTVAYFIRILPDFRAYRLVQRSESRLREPPP